MADRQVAAEFGDGGMSMGQRPLDGQGRAVLGLRRRRLARPRQQVAEVDVAVRSRLRESETAGFSSASLC